MAKRKLSDRTLKALKPAQAGARYDLWDDQVPGFGVRVNDKGKRTFILLARFNGAKYPTRRSLGDYDVLSLEEAREKARAWNKLIQKGIDPKAEEERQKRAQLRRNADTFDSVAEEYIRRVVVGPYPDKPKQRRGHVVASELRREFCARWKGRPITEIERRDVVAVINETVDRGAPYQAHNLFGNVRSLFNWAIAAEDYGLEHSPCDRIRPKMLIGERRPRQRVLEDAEIAAFWRATGRMEYPFGPLLRLLLLSGARANEVGRAQWCEVDTQQKLFTVPPERFKSDSTHLIPLTADALTILDALPRHNIGDYLFTTSFGERPISGFSKAKARLDRLMAEELRKPIEPFKIHDLRRTMRTRLASLRVSDTIAEMVIGHGRRGIQRVYDQHQYLEEMREALELWAGRLRDIVTPPPANVVSLSHGSA